MRRIQLVLMALFAMFFGCRESSGQVNCVTTSHDKELAVKIMRDLKEGASAGLQAGDLMVLAAKSLLGTPYVAGTLEEDPNEENLRIYLTKTDCILFVETCLGLVRTVLESDDKEPSFESFSANIAKMRYRKEAPYSYSDRVHYTTEWIRRQDGDLIDLTLKLGGKEYAHPIHFMSRHPKSYKQLQDADNIPKAALDLKRIEEIENELNKVPMTYIPKNKIPAAVEGIKSGDIICFVSTVDGLDIAHVAIALLDNGRVGFIHASQKEEKVVIDGKTIEDYVVPRSNLSGIKVVRPLR